MTKFSSHLLTTAALTLTASMLIACGGSSSGSPVGAVPPPPPPPAGSSEPTWTAGSFAAASSFKNQCETPRTTRDIDGNAYPDVAGSATREKFWLRSWTDETYLWYNEVTDINPANSDTRLEYFDKLKTTATTSSGTPKDQFHFNIPTDEYEQRVATGASAGYGADFVLLKADAPNRDIRVALVQPNSPASSNNNLLRGTEILEIDGEDAINGNNVNVLNAGLFPSAAGEQHTFLVRDVGSTATRTVTMTSDIVAEQPVNTTKIINTPTGKVGYILFTTFGTSTAEQQIANAFTQMKNEDINDLVLDLRYNGGGFLAIASQIAYMIAGDSQTNNAFFESLTFNNKHPTTNPVTGETLRPTPFYKESLGLNDAFPARIALDTVDLPRVFILSTDNTCSASEAVINGLRGIDVEVVLIGTKTCGKPFGFYATDNCGETYFTVQFKGVNNKGFGEYTDGFTPNNDSSVVGEKISGCIADDDFSDQLGDESENMLATALSFRANGTCPVGTTKISEKPEFGFESNPESSLLSETRVRNRLELKNSRLLYVPRDEK